MATLFYMISVVPITAATYLAIPLIVLQGLSPSSAITMSFIGSMKNIVPGVIFMVCSIVFVIVSIVPAGLGLLVSIPILMITNYTVYRSTLTLRGS